jgi:hypothetical protein
MVIPQALLNTETNITSVGFFKFTLQEVYH